MGDSVLPVEMLVIFLVIVIVGSGILYVVANKKWGYTEKRERELEEQPGLQVKEKKKGKDNV